MKAFVFAVSLLCLSVAAHAQCFTTCPLNMWYDIKRFISIAKHSLGERAIVLKLQQAREEGHAIAVPAGAKIDAITELDENISMIRIGNVWAVVFNYEITCK